MSGALGPRPRAEERLRRAERLLATGVDPEDVERYAGVRLEDVRAAVARANGGTLPPPEGFPEKTPRAGGHDWPPDRPDPPDPAEASETMPPAPRGRGVRWVPITAASVVVGAAVVGWFAFAGPPVPPPKAAAHPACHIAGCVGYTPPSAAARHTASAHTAVPIDTPTAAPLSAAKTAAKQHAAGFSPPLAPTVPPARERTSAQRATPPAQPTGRCIDPQNPTRWTPCGPANGHPFTPWAINPNELVPVQCADAMSLWAQQHVAPAAFEASPLGRLCTIAAADGVRPGGRVYPADILR